MYRALNEASSDVTFDQMYDMAKGVANVATGLKKGSKASEYSYSSLAKAASKMVAVFPVLASRTVSAETAQMVTKYIEQKMCSLFVLALQQANISTAKSGIEYLRQYHQNLNVGGDNINAIISTMDTWINAYEAGKTSDKIHEAGSISGAMYNSEDDIDVSSLFECDRDLEISARDVAEIMKIMQEQEKIVVYDTKLNPVSINDYVVKEFATGDYHVSVKPLSAFTEARNDTYDGGRAIGTAADRQARSAADSKYSSGTAEWEDEYQAQRNRQRTIVDDKDYDEKKRDEQRRRDWAKEDREQEKRDRREARSDRNTARNEHRKDRINAAIDRRRRMDREDKADRERDEDRAEAKRDREESRRDRARRSASEEISRSISGNNVSLKDFDVKKMNDAVPSMLVVRFYSKLDNGEVSTVPTEFIIGVKSKLIPVTTTEILRRIMNDNKDGKKFLKFMRVITGELSASNVIFGFSRMKDDIKSTKRKGAYGEIWNLLANRAEASREAVKHGVRNDFSAITTVLISQNDADELFREENFDISDPKNAYHFMQSYNLIAFAIADDATESLKIMMDDGEKNFEEYAYRMFERETKDGTYKKLINLMAASK